MGKKRKRPVKGDRAQDKSSQTDSAPAPTCFKSQSSLSPDHPAGHSHPVISLYYPQTVPLRQYLLRQIPPSSKSRRRRIASVRDDCSAEASDDRSKDQCQGLANLLDSTLVGILKESPPTCNQERRRELIAFTQSQSKSKIIGTDSGPLCAQTEIVDFVVSSHFNRVSFSRHMPCHLLTRGFVRAREENTPACDIPGLVAQFPNDNVQKLKQAPWTEVLGLLGTNGEEIMLGLLLDCGVFTAVDEQRGIYFQLSGLPLSMLEPMNKVLASDPAPTNTTPFIKSGFALASGVRGNAETGHQKSAQAPAPIIFFRRRILYAPPTFDSRGKVHPGLKAHVLSHFPSNSLSDTIHVLKYVFPRQFGLHNIFTSMLSGQHMQTFKDYSSREEEISQSNRRKRPRTGADVGERSAWIEIPKRLHSAVELVRQLQNRHKHCSYAYLLNYYCSAERIGPLVFSPRSSQPEPLEGDLKSSAPESLITQPRLSWKPTCSLPRPSQGPSAPEDTHLRDGIRKSVTREPKPSLTDYATPVSSVSAFCRAVLRNLIPPQFYGAGQHRIRHQDIIIKHVDRFVRMRRFENLSLHEVCQGIKVTCIPWLAPPTGSASEHKLSQTDLQKRTQLLHEFIYYVFDSILIPLIRANFYVTESQSNRNCLFYFRQDVWRRLTVKPMDELKTSIFEEIKPAMVRDVLEKTHLGYGSLRLLPKTSGIRPLLNLKRPASKTGSKTGKLWWGTSVNSIVAPIHSMLSYEKTRAPAKLGSCMYSVGEIYSRLKDFKNLVAQKQDGPLMPPFYFVKLDIQSCFDTIPQQNLVHLIERLITEEAYHYTKYVEMTPADEFHDLWRLQKDRPNKARRKFVGRAASAAKPHHLMDAITNGETSWRRNTVFVDALAQREHNAEDLLDLLDEHVRNNLVRFGKTYYRQRSGIPQGSVLSSMLCNLFYADMERQALGFLESENALLLRLVDDFLLITSDATLAMRFLQVMVKGQPSYGVSVNPTKSLVNFAAAVDGTQIPRLVDTQLFPYCGTLIDTRSLEIYKDHGRLLEGGHSAAVSLSNSLTVDFTRASGRSLHRKLLGSFKILMHPMYLDTRHNTITVVLSNVYANFVTSGMKMYRYLKALVGRAHPTPEAVVHIIRSMMQLGNQLIQARRERWPLSETTSQAGSPCRVQTYEVEHLAAAAFRFVLGRKQSRYATVLRWLDVILRETQPRAKAPAGRRLTQVVRSGNATYSGWKF